MSAVTPQKRRAWETRFKRLTKAEQKAREEVLVGVHMARKEGLTQADIAYMLSGISPSGIAAKDAKGAEILAKRKGQSSP